MAEPYVAHTAPTCHRLRQRLLRDQTGRRPCQQDWSAASSATTSSCKWNSRPRFRRHPHRNATPSHAVSPVGLRKRAARKQNRPQVHPNAKRVLESSPPLRNTPNGTSLMRCCWHTSAKSFSRSSRHCCSLSGSFEKVRSQYCSVRICPCWITIWCPG